MKRLGLTGSPLPRDSPSVHDDASERRREAAVEAEDTIGF